MNLLVIVLDTQRRDHLSAYAYPRRTSPVLDKLAADGVCFERCLTNTAHTMPSFTTMITGQGPETHGIVSTLYAHPNEPRQRLDDTTPVLAEVFRDEGYLTAAFDNLHDFGCYPAWFARGYDWYVNTWAPRHGHPCQVTADEINARLLPWLRSHATQQPWFLFVHYWDPHQPYNQPDEYRTIHSDGPVPDSIEVGGKQYRPTWGWEERLDAESREKIDLYDGELTYVDEAIGDVVGVLSDAGVYDDTTIIVTADHGEDMQEHNSPFEHREPYDTTVGVPLIVKPAQEVLFASGRSIDHLVGHIDLMPSILDMTGIDPPEEMDGRSWVSMLETDGDPLHDALFLTGSVTRQRGRWICPEVAIRSDEYTFIRRGTVDWEEGHPRRVYSTLTAPGWRGDPDRTDRDLVEYFNALPRREMYDLREDPHETTNVIEDRPEAAGELDENLQEFVGRQPDRFVIEP